MGDINNKDLSRGSSTDMSPEAIARRLEQLWKAASDFGQAELWLSIFAEKSRNASSQDQFFFRRPMRPAKPNRRTALDSLICANSMSKIDSNAELVGKVEEQNREDTAEGCTD